MEPPPLQGCPAEANGSWMDGWVSSAGTPAPPHLEGEPLPLLPPEPFWPPGPTAATAAWPLGPPLRAAWMDVGTGEGAPGPEGAPWGESPPPPRKKRRGKRGGRGRPRKGPGPSHEPPVVFPWRPRDKAWLPSARWSGPRQGGRYEMFLPEGLRKMESLLCQSLAPSDIPHGPFAMPHAAAGQSGPDSLPGLAMEGPPEAI